MIDQKKQPDQTASQKTSRRNYREVNRDTDREKQLRRCIEAFYFGYREFTTRPDKILRERGLNRVHHRILYFVGQNPGIGVGGLLEILQVSKQALNAPLKHLTGKQLVEIKSAEFDRRVKQLNLTIDGVQLESQLTQMQMDLISNAIEQSTEKNELHWLTLMNSIGEFSKDN